MVYWLTYRWLSITSLISSLPIESLTRRTISHLNYWFQLNLARRSWMCLVFVPNYLLFECVLSSMFKRNNFYADKWTATAKKTCVKNKQYTVQLVIIKHIADDMSKKQCCAIQKRCVNIWFVKRMRYLETNKTFLISAKNTKKKKIHPWSTNNA